MIVTRTLSPAPRMATCQGNIALCQGFRPISYCRRLTYCDIVWAFARRLVAHADVLLILSQYRLTVTDVARPRNFLLKACRDDSHRLRYAALSLTLSRLPTNRTCFRPASKSTSRLPIIHFGQRRKSHQLTAQSQRCAWHSSDVQGHWPVTRRGGEVKEVDDE